MYLTPEEYSGDIPAAERESRLSAASRDIDSLTFNRIVRLGFNNLTEFQRQIIKEAVKAQNIADIDKYTEELTKAWNAASEDMAKAAQAGPQPGPDANPQGPDNQGPDEQ